MKVIKCEPGKLAKIVDVENSLEAAQKEVGGFIECVYPWDDDVCLICNEEGKINGMEPCRALWDENGELVDIVFGPFLIVGDDEEHMELIEELSEDLQKKYLEKFNLAEYFEVDNGHIRVISYNPEEENK